MKKLAVVGKDVSASLSPRIHKFIAERTGNGLTYGKISLPPEAFERQMPEILKEYDGLNITIPYKLAVIPYLNGLEGDAALFGAVNTVLCGNLAGFNTDGEGFMLSLEAENVALNSESALVLGAGGAGRSVAKKLLSLGAEVSVYDRHFERSLALAENSDIKPLERLETKRYFAIINATGTGSHGTEGQSPAPKELLKLCSVAADLIYAPRLSKFLETAKECGIKTVNGTGMLFFQAYYSQCIFFGKEPQKREAEELFKEYLRETE